MLAVVFGASASACTQRMDDQCAVVQARVLEEVRVVDAFHDHLLDARAVMAQAQRLRAVSAELRALNIQDPGLRDAVEHYLVTIDGLAEAYARAADSHASAAPDGGADAGDPSSELVTLGARLSTHAAAVNGARSAISRACGAAPR